MNKKFFKTYDFKSLVHKSSLKKQPVWPGSVSGEGTHPAPTASAARAGTDPVVTDTA